MYKGGGGVRRWGKEMKQRLMQKGGEPTVKVFLGTADEITAENCKQIGEEIRLASIDPTDPSAGVKKWPETFYVLAYQQTLRKRTGGMVYTEIFNTTADQARGKVEAKESDEVGGIYKSLMDMWGKQTPASYQILEIRFKGGKKDESDGGFQQNTDMVEFLNQQAFLQQQRKEATAPEERVGGGGILGYDALLSAR